MFLDMGKQQLQHHQIPNRPHAILLDYDRAFALALQHERKLEGIGTINLNENNASISNVSTNNRRSFGAAKRPFCIRCGLQGTQLKSSTRNKVIHWATNPNPKPTTGSVNLTETGLLITLSHPQLNFLSPKNNATNCQPSSNQICSPLHPPLMPSYQTFQKHIIKEVLLLVPLQLP